MGPSSKKLHKGKFWDFGTKLGLFWDHFYTFLGLLVVIFIKMPQNSQKAKKAFKTRVVEMFNVKLRPFGDHFWTLYQIYIKMKNIPDIYWPGVFQYQDSNRTTDTPGFHLLTTNQTQIISKTRTHRSQQSILLQLFFATQCYTSGSEIWDLHAKLGLFWDQIWTLVPFGTKSQIWDFIIAPACRQLWG